MLFNSPVFIFLFLPIVLLVFYTLKNKEIAAVFLVLSSLFFYGWWNPAYLFLIILSMLGNFYLGEIILKYHKKWHLIFGIACNLLAIIYFKYTFFIASNITQITGYRFDIQEMVLPLAISFFTFQQIAYLVDTWHGKTEGFGILKYSLFVTFFPQLIAGPIVHHREMLPQFDRYALSSTTTNLSIGLSIFSIGLFKKTVIADPLATYANPIFLLAEGGTHVEFFSAWLGTVAYSLQLYFDFSGYSDMAVGLAWMFGIVLPLNFYSPYKSFSIIEFWRRWHMTLSRFLRDYIYIPLGGNRKGRFAKFTFLMITMLLGGLWHGAGWSFVIWGALHGFYLIINHAWVALIPPDYRGKVPIFFYWFLTILSVMVGWVFFRATSLDGAINIISGMSGINGFALPNGIVSRFGDFGLLLKSAGLATYSGGGANFASGWLLCFVFLFVSLFAPNIQDLFKKYEPTLNKIEFGNGIKLGAMERLLWADTPKWAVISSLFLLFG